MNTIVTFEPCSRSKGDPEFIAFSLKKEMQVRFFNRVSLWRWAVAEFDPTVFGLRVNEQSLYTPNGKVPIRLSYETNITEVLIFYERKLDEAIRTDITEYAVAAGCNVEILSHEYLISNEIEAVNCLNMLSYIIKHREVLTDRSLEQCVRILRGCDVTVQEAVSVLAMDFRDAAGSIFFEAVRRGLINLPDVKKMMITGRTKFNVGGIPVG